LQDSPTVKIVPKFLPKGIEDKIHPVLIGKVTENDHFWSSQNTQICEKKALDKKTADKIIGISAEFWRDEVKSIFHNL
jgi:hypothetical protein